MSASEKLKRLDMRFEADADALADALPALIAVVEAAELKPTHVWVGIPMEDGRPSGRVRYPIVEALTALDDALGDVT